MKKPILNTRGGEFDYSAPTLEILSVNVEQGFATSGSERDYWADIDPWDDEIGEEVDFY